jgi:hypothetical protein
MKSQLIKIHDATNGRRCVGGTRYELPTKLAAFEKVQTEAAKRAEFLAALPKRKQQPK